jgi:hypothetical protein
MLSPWRTEPASAALVKKAKMATANALFSERMVTNLAVYDAKNGVIDTL